MRIACVMRTVTHEMTQSSKESKCWVGGFSFFISLLVKALFIFFPFGFAPFSFPWGLEIRVWKKPERRKSSGREKWKSQ